VTRAAERVLAAPVPRRNRQAATTVAVLTEVVREPVATVPAPERVAERVPRRNPRAEAVAAATAASAATTPVGKRPRTVRAARRAEVRRTVAVAVALRRTVAAVDRDRQRAAVLRVVAAAVHRAAVVAVAAAAAADVDREGAKTCAHSHQSMARPHP
jgi:hypothetical protein